MAIDKKIALVLASCLISRSLVPFLFPSLSGILDSVVQFSTPVSSFRALKEGIYLQKHGMSLYDGGVVHQSPLLIGLFSYFISCNLLVTQIFSILDTLIVYNLMAISNIFGNIVPQPWIVGVLYVINPLTLLSSVARSTAIFNFLGITYAILYALKGNILLSAISLAFASNISLYSTILILPLLYNLPGKQKTQKNKTKYCSIFLLSFIALLLISFTINGFNWNFIYATFFTDITYNKFFPNMGLWWYFFIEMFEPFLPFFKALFNLFVICLPICLTIRFKSTQPFFTTLIIIAWITLTKPYPTLSDAGFFISLIPFFKPIFPYIRYPIVSSLMFIHAVILSPIFYHIWIDTGSGNSNFFYAITLVYALALALIIMEFLWGMIRWEYDEGIVKTDKKITQI